MRQSAYFPCAGRRTPGRSVRGRLLRTLICQAIILNLLIWPSPRVTFGASTDNVSNLAGAAGSLALSAASIVASVGTRRLDAFRTDHDTGPYPTYLAVRHICAADNYD